jgi:predicted extracellular nuclease
MDPDILGVNELENDGYGPTSAIQFLVDRLNAATASGTYAFIDVYLQRSQFELLKNPYVLYDGAPQRSV